MTPEIDARLLALMQDIEDPEGLLTPEDLHAATLKATFPFGTPAGGIQEELHEVLGVSIGESGEVDLGDGAIAGSFTGGVKWEVLVEALEERRDRKQRERNAQQED